MKYTVVVAEDEELLLNNLVQKIQKADPDFQVTGTAQTGEQAFALVEKLTPDLVITDIRTGHWISVRSLQLLINGRIVAVAATQIRSRSGSGRANTMKV